MCDMNVKGMVLEWEGIGEGEGIGKEGDQKETTKNKLSLKIHNETQFFVIYCKLIS